MAVESFMLSLGTSAPAFTLRDVVSGEVYQLDSFAGSSALLVMFICRHCPYVVHVEQGSSARRGTAATPVVARRGGDGDGDGVGGHGLPGR